MKKKKLKVSFHSLLEDDEDILEEVSIVPEITLPDDPVPEKKAVIDETELLKSLSNYEPGDLVGGIEILEELDRVLESASLDKNKHALVKKIRKIMGSVIEDDETEAFEKVNSLAAKLAGNVISKTSKNVRTPKKQPEKQAKKAVEKKEESKVKDYPVKQDQKKLSPAKTVPDTITIIVEDSDIMASFIQEAKEHLADIEEKILSFENEGDQEILNTIFRSVHTVKGTSAFLNLDSVKTLSHRLEFLLDDLRNGKIAADSSLIDTLLEGTDFLSIMIDELSENFFASRDGKFDLRTYSDEITDLENKFNLIGRDNPVPVSSGALPGSPDPQSDPPVSNDIAESFVLEAEDLLDEAETFLLELEEDGGTERGSNIDVIFRNIHTIKGNAGFLGFSTVERLAMQMESTLDTIRKNKKQVTSGVITLLLQTLDLIKRNIASPGSLDEEADVTVKALGEILLEEGKIEKEDLEKALDIQEMKVGEILLTEGKISKEDLSRALKVQGVQKPKGSSGTVLAPVERKDIRVDMSKVDKLFNLMGELITAEEIIIHNPEIEKLKNLERSVNYLSKITREMQEITMSIRMIPLEGLFNRMRRLVRDLSKKVNKKTDLKIFGQDTEMDKNVTEEIADPLVHIIRNSLDHGLELGNERVKKGKREIGTITLGAKYEGNEIWISIADDGAGLNREKIITKALASGIVDPESVSTMRDEEIWSLIFAPGFSTAEKVTEVSGRGVGMDVVKSNIEKLRGKVSIKSEKDTGTEITLKIPLTLAIMDGVTVKVGNIVFALPISDIREFHKASLTQITEAESGKDVLKLRNTIFPVIKLSQVYDQKDGVSSVDQGIFLIVEAGEKKAALLVDEIIGYHQIVVKALPDSLKGLSSISGCSIMGNGDVNLIIDCGALLNEVLV